MLKYQPKLFIVPSLKHLYEYEQLCNSYHSIYYGITITQSCHYTLYLHLHYTHQFHLT